MEILFRSHSFGDLMKNDRSGKNIGKTAITAVKQLAREKKTGRRKIIKSKYLTKGTEQEEQAIDLLSFYLGKLLVKNDTRINNDFVTGEPDLFIGKNIIGCSEGFDTKCSWDIFSFPYIDDELDEQYYWQAMCYMWLTGAEKWTVAYCLVNTPPQLIDNEKKSLYYSMNCPNDDNEAYVNGLIEIEKNSIFNLQEFKEHYPYYDLTCENWTFDIPMDDRVMLFEVKRDNVVIEKMQQRAIEMKKLFEFYYQSKTK